MLDESEPSTLFDIPEDKTVDSDATFDNYFENVPTTTEEESNKVHPTTFLQKLSSKFQKSGAEGGADVMALRGIYGADFEGYAMVSRKRKTNNKRNLGSLLELGKNNDAKKRFLLIKGAFCFVFKDELSPAPKYVIRLAYTKTRVVDDEEEEASNQQDVLNIKTTTVVMETINEQLQEDDFEYELVFVRERYANGFAAVANHMALQGETDEIQQRFLGHGHCHLLQTESLIRSAEQIAMEIMDDHPRIIDMPENSTSARDYLRTPIGVH